MLCPWAKSRWAPTCTASQAGPANPVRDLVQAHRSSHRRGCHDHGYVWSLFGHSPGVRARALSWCSAHPPFLETALGLRLQHSSISTFPHIAGFVSSGGVSAPGYLRHRHGVTVRLPSTTHPAACCLAVVILFPGCHMDL